MTKRVLSAVAAATAALSLSAFAQSPAATPVDPNSFLDPFEAPFGKFEGFRRSSAKGVCAVGEFVGTAEARALSTSSAFSGRPVPVMVRFAVGGASPMAPDNAKAPRAGLDVGDAGAGQPVHAGPGLDADLTRAR